MALTNTEIDRGSVGLGMERSDPGAYPGGVGADEDQLAWLTAKHLAGKSRPHHYLLLLRFALVNIFGFALLGAAHMYGFVELVLAADQTSLSALIFVVFLGGLGLCGRKIWQVSRELNQVRSFNPLVPSRAGEYLAMLRGAAPESRAIYASSLRLKLTQRIGPVRNVANSLVLLGLIGTVIGFIIALSGVQPEQAGDVNAITPMVSTLIAGMSTALYTTLVGSVLNVWLMVNYQLLAGGTVRLITALLEFGEGHARA